MSSPYFLLFELIIYVQLALCLLHAWRQGTGNLLRPFYCSARRFAKSPSAFFTIKTKPNPIPPRC